MNYKMLMDCGICSVRDSNTMDIPHRSIAASTTPNKLPAILGGTLGGLAGLVLIALGILFFVRRRARQRNAPKFDLHLDPPASPKSEYTPQTATIVTPFTNDREPHVSLSPLRRTVTPVAEVPSKSREAGIMPMETQTQDDGLRREVEQLRQEMGQLRVQQTQQLRQVSDHEEPPPDYDL